MQPITEQNITAVAAERWSSAHDPRLAHVMQALVRHLHDFARRVGLTELGMVGRRRVAVPCGADQ